MIKFIITCCYLITILIAYIILRFINIKGKGDEPQGVSLFMAFFWPTIIIFYIFYIIGKFIDYCIKFILKINDLINGKVTRT